MARVFIFCQNPLFGEGVENLLHRDPELRIVGSESDPTRAIEQINALQPDVVIIDGDSPVDDLGPALASILKQNAHARVIGLNLQSNTMCMYRGEKRVVREVNDLLEAIG